MRPRTCSAACFVLVLATVLTGANRIVPADGVTIVTLVGGTWHSPDAVTAATSGREMAHVVATTISRILSVPAPPHVVLRTYSSRAALREGLVSDVGVSRRLALDLSRTAIGLAFARTIVLLDEGPDEDRLRLIAHELMHVVQHELAGPDARPAQWLSEGTAEWAALAVLDDLGGPGVPARRQQARRVAHTYLARHADFTPSAVRRPTDFRRWQRRVGDLRAYQVAYALAEALVDGHGTSAIVAYFRALGTRLTHAAAFEQAFGMSSAGFIARLRVRFAHEPAEDARAVRHRLADGDGSAARRVDDGRGQAAGGYRDHTSERRSQ